jgi:hypothetical protein
VVCLGCGAASAQQAPSAGRVGGARVSPGVLLNMRIPELAFDQAPVSAVFEFLAELAGTNVVIRWELLEPFGIERDTPITMRARNLRFSQVLWIVLNEAAPDQTKLGYRLDSDVLLVTTAEDLGRETLTVVYDVRDMLQPEIANPSIRFGRDRTYVQSVDVTVAEGAVAVRPITGVLQSGSRLETENPGGTIRIGRQNGDEQDVGSGTDDRMRELIDVLTNSIEPDSWRVNGGDGTVQAFNGLLIIRNTPLVHQQIGGAVRR